MSQTKKIKKEDIIKRAIFILQTEGMEHINARRIAKDLGCSVQPIFYNFANMEDLKQEVLQKAYHIYQSYMLKGSKEEKAYKGMGLSYIRFARDYPNFFRAIFMNSTSFSPEGFILNDSKGNDVILKGMELTGFSFEEQKEFHVKVWIFTHGLATLVASNTVQILDEEIDNLLAETVREMIIGRKCEKNGKNS